MRVAFLTSLNEQVFERVLAGHDTIHAEYFKTTDEFLTAVNMRSKSFDRLILFSNIVSSIPSNERRGRLEAFHSFLLQKLPALRIVVVTKDDKASTSFSNIFRPSPLCVVAKLEKLQSNVLIDLISLPIEELRNTYSHHTPESDVIVQAISRDNKQGVNKVADTAGSVASADNSSGIAHSDSTVGTDISKNTGSSSGGKGTENASIKRKNGFFSRIFGVFPTGKKVEDRENGVIDDINVDVNTSAISPLTSGSSNITDNLDMQSAQSGLTDKQNGAFDNHSVANVQDFEKSSTSANVDQVLPVAGSYASLRGKNTGSDGDSSNEHSVSSPATNVPFSNISGSTLRGISSDGSSNSPSSVPDSHLNDIFSNSSNSAFGSVPSGNGTGGNVADANDNLDVLLHINNSNNPTVSNNIGHDFSTSDTDNPYSSTNNDSTSGNINSGFISTEYNLTGVSGDTSNNIGVDKVADDFADTYPTTALLTSGISGDTVSVTDLRTNVKQGRGYNAKAEGVSNVADASGVTGIDNSYKFDADVDGVQLDIDVSEPSNTIDEPSLVIEDSSPTVDEPQDIDVDTSFVGTSYKGRASRIFSTPTDLPTLDTDINDVAPTVENVSDVSQGDMGDIDILGAEKNYAINNASHIVERVVEKIVEKPVEIERVVERVVEQTVYVNNNGYGGNYTYKDIASRKVRAMFVVTGDRRSGVTTTAMTLANTLGNVCNTLYVDFDTVNKGSILELGIADIVDESEHIQNGLGVVTNKLLSQVVFRSNNTMFASLISNFGYTITDERITEVSNILAVQQDYGAVVIDCPLSKLHLLDQILDFCELFVCIDGSAQSFVNTIGQLNDLNSKGVSVRQMNILQRSAKFIVTGSTSVKDFEKTRAYVDSLFNMSKSTIAWITLPLFGHLNKLPSLIVNKK